MCDYKRTLGYDRPFSLTSHSVCCARRGLYPWWKVFARESAPLVALLLLSGAALALVSEAVEVRLLEELLAGQPLGRVHPQAALRQVRETATYFLSLTRKNLKKTSSLATLCHAKKMKCQSFTKPTPEGLICANMNVLYYMF